MNDNFDWGYEAFGGVSVSNTDILVKYAYVGDANLRRLDQDDFGQFLAGYSNAAADAWLFGASTTVASKLNA